VCVTYFEHEGFGVDVRGDERLQHLGLGDHVVLLEQRVVGLPHQRHVAVLLLHLLATLRGTDEEVDGHERRGNYGNRH